MDRRRFLEFANLLFGLWEQAFHCHLNGTIDGSTWTGWDGFARDKLATDGYRVVWPHFRAQYFATFGAHVEKVLVEHPPTMLET